MDCTAVIVVVSTIDVVTAAFAVADRFGLSHWDALIVAAAQAAGCDHLLTEDLRDGQRLGDVTVVDPFQHRPEAMV